MSRKAPRPVAWVGTSAILLFLLAHAYRDQDKNDRAAAQQHKGPSGMVTAGKIAVCPPPGHQDSVVEYTATLSESVTKVALQCMEGATDVHPGLALGVVCPGDIPAEKFQGCRHQGQVPLPPGTIAAVGLSELMGGPAFPPVSWRATVLSEEGNVHELTLPKVPLPFIDTKFAIGCLSDTRPGPACMMRVTVEARKSTVSGQTVYCAYGANSNKTKHTVKMTTENNKVTLVCGTKEKGALQPTSYQTSYCAGRDVDNACKEEPYTTFIKEFKPTWWTEDEATQSVSLTIPPEHFPDTAKRIHLGCKYKGKEIQPSDSSTETTTRLTTCLIDVVIGARWSTNSGNSTIPVAPSLFVAAFVFSVSPAI